MSHIACMMQAASQLAYFLSDWTRTEFALKWFCTCQIGKKYFFKKIVYSFKIDYDWHRIYWDELNVGDGGWRRFAFVTGLRCWLPIFFIHKITNIKIIFENNFCKHHVNLSPSSSDQHHCQNRIQINYKSFIPKSESN